MRPYPVDPGAVYLAVRSLLAALVMVAGVLAWWTVVYLIEGG